MSPGDAPDRAALDRGPIGRGDWLRRVVAAAQAARRFPDGSTFWRGLSIGALVGAAIAGSTIWERRRHRDAASESGAESASDANT